MRYSTGSTEPVVVHAKGAGSNQYVAFCLVSEHDSHGYSGRIPLAQGARKQALKSSQAISLSRVFQTLNGTASEKTGVKELATAIRFINRLIGEYKFDLLGRILLSCKLDKMAPQMIIAFVRAIHPVRSRVRGWRRFVEKAKAELDQRGLDGAKLLRGVV